MPEFVGGLRLGGLFYEEAVKPVLDSEFAGLVHSAALIGYGSEVLGYDTPLSTDHEWGPRLLLFLTEEDYESRRERITEVLSRKLPYKFMGYSTQFGKPDEEGVRLRQEKTSGTVDHEVSPFHSRPYLVIHAERFAAAIDAAITDPEVSSLPIEAGSVDQVTDNTDVLGQPEVYGRLRALYR